MSQANSESSGGPATRGLSGRWLQLILVCVCSATAQQTVDVAPVISKKVERTIALPGEFLAWQSVAIRAKVAGYVERMLVDRGSAVKQGQLLAELSAPEIAAQIAEAQSRIGLARADSAQAEAQLAASQATYERMKKAAETPGAIAGNEMIQVEKQVQAAQALVNSRREATRAAEAALRSLMDISGYLRITAPFDGVITDRLVHPGALVKPDSEPPLVILQQISRLRLVVAVPEQYVGNVVQGRRVAFTVPAHPERVYTGAIARLAHALDEKTRTMSVELDVANRDGSLSPGMYPTVQWPAGSRGPRLLAPQTAVVTTSERMFVIRVANGKAEWVDVRKGAPVGDNVEIFGPLSPGDMIIRRATDEIHDGARVAARTEPRS
jgi:RND family efflux transporter MFP subunit